MLHFKKALFCFILIILTFASYFRLFYLNKLQKNNEFSPKEEVYTIKDYNGKIAVFCNNSNKPIEVFETPQISELPTSDQKKLKLGIKAFSKKEVVFLLQDYDN